MKWGKRLLRLPPIDLSHLILKHISLINVEYEILTSVELGSDPAH